MHGAPIQKKERNMEKLLVVWVKVEPVTEKAWPRKRLKKYDALQKKLQRQQEKKFLIIEKKVLNVLCEMS